MLRRGWLPKNLHRLQVSFALIDLLTAIKRLVLLTAGRA